MRKKLNWAAYCSENRLIAIENIKDTINTNDGFIINFAMFSDLALNLSIEIEEHKIKALHDALNDLLNISELDDKVLNHNSKKEWLIFLNVSFANGKGNYKIEIPEIPG